MRQIATVKNNAKIKRLMVYKSDGGCYLFFYDRLEDSACYADHWYENLEDLQDICLTEYAVLPTDWTTIPDPLPNCQHDWINYPVAKH